MFRGRSMRPGYWSSIMPPRLITNTWDRIIDNGIPIGRICFGLALLIFGAMHFVYHDFTASFIPAWFPYREWLAIFTGAAHIAAGLAILTGVLGQLGATLAGIMYLSWVFVLHIPRVVAAPKDPFEWNGIFVASLLSGAAFFVAATFIKSAEGEPKQRPRCAAHNAPCKKAQRHGSRTPHAETRAATP